MERHLSNVGSFRGGPDVIKALESSELSMRENALRQWGAVPVGRRLPHARRAGARAPDRHDGHAGG